MHNIPTSRTLNYKERDKKIREIRREYLSSLQEEIEDLIEVYLIRFDRAQEDLDYNTDEEVTRIINMLAARYGLAQHVIHPPLG